MTEELDGTLIVPRFAPRIHPTPIPALGVFDEPLVCLSVNRFWVSHVLGVLEALDQPDTWIGTALEIEAARQNVRELILALAEGNCVPNTFDVRQNEEEPCILEKTADGLIWVPFAMLDLCAAPVKPDTVKYPDDMRIDPVTGDLQYSFDGTTWYDYPATNTPEPTEPYIPPRVQPEGATEHEKRCAAASSAANALNQMYEQTYGAIAAGIANSWGEFTNFMNDVTDFVFGITYGTVWDIVKIIGLWEPLDLPTTYAAATLDPVSLDALTCLIYTHTTIDAEGYAQVDFGAVVDNVIAELGVNPGTAVWTHLNYLQASGLERIADVGFGDTTICDNCIPGWNALDGYGLRGMQMLAFGTCSAPGTYDAINDKIDGGKCIIGGDAVSGLRVRHTFDPVTINSITVRWTQGHNNNKGFDVRLFRNGVQVGHAYWANNVYDMTRAFSFGGIVADRFDMEMWSKIPGTVHPTLNIQRISVSGTGTPPPF